MEFHQFFQQGFDSCSGHYIYYYVRLPPLPKKPVRLLGFGRLDNGIWSPWRGNDTHGLGRISIWKEKVPLPGEGRIEGGLMIKNRGGLGGPEVLSLAQCNLPPEYDIYIKKMSELSHPAS
jgi:hypothetical protein